MIYMGIFFPSRSTRARPCLRGSHGQTPDKPVCMIYVSEYLRGVFKSSFWREASITSLPCCPPPTPPPELPPLPASPADCLRQRRAAALCGRCSATCQFLRLFFFVFHTSPVDWCATTLRGHRKNRKSMSICVSKKWKIKCRNFLPLRKTSSSAMCFDTSVKTRCTAQRRGPLSSRVPQIINLNLSKQSLSSGPASPSSLCCSYALPLVFLREQRVELNHYFLKEIITSDQWSDALPAP